MEEGEDEETPGPVRLVEPFEWEVACYNIDVISFLPFPVFIYNCRSVHRSILNSLLRQQVRPTNMLSAVFVITGLLMGYTGFTLL